MLNHSFNSAADDDLFLMQLLSLWFWCLALKDFRLKVLQQNLEYVKIMS